MLLAGTACVTPVPPQLVQCWGAPAVIKIKLKASKGAQQGTVLNCCATETLRQPSLCQQSHPWGTLSSPSFLTAWGWDASWLALFWLRGSLATHAGGRYCSSSQKPAVGLFGWLPVTFLPLLSLWPGCFYREAHATTAFQCAAVTWTLAEGKKWTILCLVAYCAEPPHQLESSSLLHPDAQTVCLPKVCLVLHETLSLKWISVRTARSSFRESCQEGGSFCMYTHLVRWAWSWKRSFYSQVVKSIEGVKQRKRGRFAEWPQIINQSSTNPCPLCSLTSQTLHFSSWQLLSLGLLSSGQFPSLPGQYESSLTAPTLQVTVPPTCASSCASYFAEESLILSKPPCLAYLLL